MTFLLSRRTRRRSFAIVRCAVVNDTRHDHKKSSRETLPLRISLLFYTCNATHLNNTTMQNSVLFYFEAWASHMMYEMLPVWSEPSA